MAASQLRLRVFTVDLGRSVVSWLGTLLLLALCA
jgi:hypothetical protein